MGLAAERHKVVGQRRNLAGRVKTHFASSDESFEAMRQMECKPLQCVAWSGCVSEHEHDQVLDQVISDPSCQPSPSLSLCLGENR